MKALTTAIFACSLVSVVAQDQAVAPTEIEATRSTWVIKNGVYSDLELNWKFEGTKDAPILIRAETAGGVTLSGKTSLTIDGQFVSVSGLKFENAEAAGKELISLRGVNNSLTDCAVIACNPADTDREDKWIALRGKNHRVANCTFRGKTSPSVTLTVWRAEGAIDGHLIEGNHFVDRPRVSDGNGYETIRIGTSDTAMSESRSVIRANLFEGCDGEMEIISLKSGGNLVAGNTFKECAGTITLRHGNANRIESNVFAGKLKKETGGVRVTGENHVIFGNAFIGTTGRAEGALALLCADENPQPSGHHPVKNVVVEANLFVANEGPAIVLDGEISQRPVLPTNVVVKSNGLSGAALENLVRGADKAAQTGLVWSGNQIYRGNAIPRDVIQAMPKPLSAKNTGAFWLR